MSNFPGGAMDAVVSAGTIAVVPTGPRGRGVAQVNVEGADIVFTMSDGTVERARMTIGATTIPSVFGLAEALAGLTDRLAAVEAQVAKLTPAAPVEPEPTPTPEPDPLPDDIVPSP